MSVADEPSAVESDSLSAADVFLDAPADVSLEIIHPHRIDEGAPFQDAEQMPQVHIFRLDCARLFDAGDSPALIGGRQFPKRHQSCRVTRSPPLAVAHDKGHRIGIGVDLKTPGGPTAIGQLHAVRDVVEHIIESDDYQGCIFVNAAVEFPLPHEPAHVAASQNKQSMEVLVLALAEDAGADDPHGQTPLGHGESSSPPARQLCEEP